MKTLTRRTIAFLSLNLGLTLTLVGTAYAAKPAAVAPKAVKVMIVSMFAPEGKTWLDHFGPTQDITVPGLSPDYPQVHCTRDDVCLVTTGMGHTNAAATMAALVYSGKFDLRKTYFLVAGIAGIDPAQGTLGSVAWARYLVDFGMQWEIDAREIPAGWKSGFLGINTKNENEKPVLEYRTELFQLNEALLQKAFALSRNAALTDSPAAQTYRAKYNYAPANQPPSVIQCDTLAGDTWFSGNIIGQRARDWTKQLTDGKGTYCTTQQEDNATFEVIKRAAAAGLADTARVAVLRAGSDFDRPPQGVSSVDNLLNYQDQGAFGPAVDNLYRAGWPVVDAIVKDWKHWKDGVPAN